MIFHSFAQFSNIPDASINTECFGERASRVVSPYAHVCYLGNVCHPDDSYLLFMCMWGEYLVISGHAHSLLTLITAKKPNIWTNGNPVLAAAFGKVWKLTITLHVFKVFLFIQFFFLLQWDSSRNNIFCYISNWYNLYVMFIPITSDC